MTIKVTHQPNPNLETIIIPIGGKNTLESALPVLESEYGVSPNLIRLDFKGDSGEVHTIYSKEGKRAFLIGLGTTLSFSATLKAFRQLSHKYKRKLSSKLSINYLYNNSPENIGEQVEAALNGLVLGTYQIGRFKTEIPDEHPLALETTLVNVICEPESKATVKESAEKGVVIAKTQMSILDLVNAPSNKKTPSHLGEWALNSAEKYGYSTRVMDKKQIEKTGLEALLAVNRGSEHPPVFIIMEYKGGTKSSPTIGLVGKGVTFDSGGLSLKPSNNMHYMKSDMGGAAAVFGTLEVAAKLKLPVNLVGIVPSTDNSIGTNAIKPSDVINSYSGKTIEIIDTDAEGRLILADGIAYMLKHYKPSTLIDLATLTGSAVRTFGYHAGVLFSNDDQLARQLANAGDRTGERVWRLPIWEVYKEDLKSDVADIRNFSGKPVAGAIAAAKFLEFFTEKHPSWAHLDIAGVAFGDTEFTTQKSATGYGIRLLIELLREMSSSHKEKMASAQTIPNHK